MLSFEEEISTVINRHSAENPSGTPDYILATYLTNCLKTFNEAVTQRAEWRGESVDLPIVNRCEGAFVLTHESTQSLIGTFCKKCGSVWESHP